MVGLKLELKKFSTIPKIYLTHVRQILPNIFEVSVIRSRVDITLVLSKKVPRVFILIFLSLLVLVFDGTLNVNSSH